MSAVPIVQTTSYASATCLEEQAAPAPAPAAADASETPKPPLVLHLKPKPHIHFTEDTVDNEHLGRKSSKRCCP